MGFAGTPLPTVRGWEHGAQVAAATACCSPPRERWEIFQVKIRAAGAATQLVEYETGVEIDSVFFQQRQIFLFEGHLPMMFLLGMDVLHHRQEIRFAHADCCTTAANGIFRSVAGRPPSCEFRPGIQPQRTRRATSSTFRWNG